MTLLEVLNKATHHISHWGSGQAELGEHPDGDSDNQAYCVTIETPHGIHHMDGSPTPEDIITALHPEAIRIILESGDEDNDRSALVGIEWKDGEPIIAFCEEQHRWRPTRD